MKSMAILIVCAGLVVPSSVSAASACLMTGGKATYASGGKYTYTAPNGKTFSGKWSGSPQAGGAVNVLLPNGNRHDRFVMEGGQLYMITKHGSRYAVRFC